jgi:transposase
MPTASPEIVEENLRLREEVASLKLEVNDLLAKLRYVAGQRFASSQSEKLAPLQGSLFNEAEFTVEAGSNEDDSDVIKVEAHERKRKKRKPLSDHLPRDIFKHDLDESDRQCPHGHGLMEQTGTAVTEQLEYFPARYRVLRHECSVYGCLVCEGRKTAALLHPQPLPGTMATPSLLAQVVVAKYCDHLPLFRQETIFARDGIFITRTTLASWIIKIAEKLVPLVVLLREAVVANDIVQMDETRIQVLALPGKDAPSRCYMWVMVGGTPEHPAVIFEFDPSRGGAVASRLLEGFAGYLQADGYDGYNAVCRRDDVERIGCLMHIRRPFRAAFEQLKGVGGGEIAKQALAYIQALYKIEDEAKAVPKLNRPAMTPDERKSLRDAKSAPILAEFHAFAEKSLSLVRPKSPTGEALSYCLNEWPYFIRFMDDGRLEIDNGRAERAIRPFAQGRRNWLFADTEAGAKASATLFTLIESAKLNGREPRRYLQYVFEKIDRATTLADLEALLPWNSPPPE